MDFADSGAGTINGTVTESDSVTVLANGTNFADADTESAGGGLVGVTGVGSNATVGTSASVEATAASERTSISTWTT